MNMFIDNCFEFNVLQKVQNTLRNKTFNFLQSS